MSVLDAFNSDNFSCQSLTDSINKVPYIPKQLEEMGLFEEEGIPTTSVLCEYDGQTLKLVPNTPRTSPAGINPVEKKKARTFQTTHLPIQDSVLADDVQNKRAWGSDSQLQTVSVAVARKLLQMRNNLEATREHLRVGAIKGKIYDSDGTTEIYDLYTEFGISESSQDFDFSDSSTDVRGLCTAVARLVQDGMGGVPFTGVGCLASDGWFDSFISHAKVIDAYRNWESNEWMRRGMAYSGGFTYGGITFWNYRGEVNSVSFIPSHKARFFPIGGMGVFRGYNAPANYVETANTIGIPMYAKSEIMPFGKGLALEAQSNPIYICHYPEALVEGTSTGASS